MLSGHHSSADIGMAHLTLRSNKMVTLGCNSDTIKYIFMKICVTLFTIIYLIQAYSRGVQARKKWLNSDLGIFSLNKFGIPKYLECQIQYPNIFRYIRHAQMYLAH